MGIGLDEQAVELGLAGLSRDQLSVFLFVALTPEETRAYCEGSVAHFDWLVGLGAPYWDPHARGTIVGLTRGVGRARRRREASTSSP